MDIKKIAEEVVSEDAMSLAEHDIRYHDGKYRGGKCMYREELAKGDRSDEELAEVNQHEAQMYFAWKREMDELESAVKEKFGKNFGGARNMTVRALQADGKGDAKLTIWCKTDVPDEAVKEQDLAKLLKDCGFTLNSFGIFTQQANNNRSSGNIKPRKVFVGDIHKKVMPTVRSGSESDKGSIKVDNVASETLSDEEKSRSLKKYGVKSEGGVIKKRTSEDNMRDRAAKYLNMIGDWQ